MINDDSFYPGTINIPEGDHEYYANGEIKGFKCPGCRGSILMDQNHVCFGQMGRPVTDLYTNCENCNLLLKKRNLQHQCTVQTKRLSANDVLDIKGVRLLEQIL